jgi:hypothetical protein
MSVEENALGGQQNARVNSKGRKVGTYTAKYKEKWERTVRKQEIEA